jgi:hypothetical protein
MDSMDRRARTAVRHALKWVDLIATSAATLFLLVLHMLGPDRLAAGTVWWTCLALVLAASAAKAAEILLPRPNLRRRRSTSLRTAAPLREPERWALESLHRHARPIVPATALFPAAAAARAAHLAIGRAPARSRALDADWQLIEPEPAGLGEGVRS